jgi:hypothetical protein
MYTDISPSLFNMRCEVLAFRPSNLFDTAKTNHHRLLRRPFGSKDQEQYDQYDRSSHHISIHHNRGCVHFFEDEKDKGHSFAGTGRTSSAEESETTEARARTHGLRDEC